MTLTLYTIVYNIVTVIISFPSYFIFLTNCMRVYTGLSVKKTTFFISYYSFATWQMLVNKLLVKLETYF